MKTLKAYQQRGRDFLAANAHALLADEPGLGKTIQAIAAAEKIGAHRIIVVCPASVRLTWTEELRECLSRRSGSVWVIFSYNEAVKRNSEVVAGWDLLILDEGHFLKTADSQRTQAIFGRKTGLARKAGRIWVLTGTPVLNRPVELWPALKTLAPAFAKMSFAAYANRYCGAYFDGRGLNTKGASHLDELRGKLEGFMLRRTIDEVLPELPQAIVTRVPLEPSDEGRSFLRMVEDEIEDREAFVSAAREEFSQLGDLSKLLRVTGLAKVRGAAAYVEDLLGTQEKVVVFTRHREVLSNLYDALSGFNPVAYQGGMTDREKAEAVGQFVNAPERRVFIGNIAAAGTGINGLQTVAQDAVFAELSWAPKEMEQAVGRLRRIGQRGSCVRVHLLHVPGSLESAVLGVNDAKNSVINRLLPQADRGAAEAFADVDPIGGLL